MDSIVGICGADWVVFAADTTVNFSVLVLSAEEDKIMNLGDNKILGCVGNHADRVQFSEFCQKNVKLYSLRTGTNLSAHATASWIREELAVAIRKAPYQSFILLGGVDPEEPVPSPSADPLATSSNSEENTPAPSPMGVDATPALQKYVASLYSLDYLGTQAKIRYGAHGYGASFVLGLLDRFYRPDMSLDEGVKLLEACVKEIQKRLIISAPAFTVKCVDPSGIRVLHRVAPAQPPDTQWQPRAPAIQPHPPINTEVTA